MYIFKIKLFDKYKNPSYSFSFPTKAPKGAGSSTTKYHKDKDNLGWLKCKSEKEAIKGFIHTLNRAIITANGHGEYYTKKTLSTKEKMARAYKPTSCIVNDDQEMIDRFQKDLEFLESIMEETKKRYLNTYPEAFI
jgi:hypothetical protein